MGTLTMRIVAAGEDGGSITFPLDTSREDFERMKDEILAAIVLAELRGEQKAIAFLMGEGSGPPVGIVKQSELMKQNAETIAVACADATVLVGIDENDDGEGWIELEG